MKDKVYLIDGSAYIYRAYHGVKPLSNSKGLHTHAVFGFINIMGRLLRERGPKYMAVAFDSRGKVFRHEIYPEYKANRPSMPEDLAEQIPFIKSYVKASNVLVLESEGIEADDLIASAARRLAERGCEVVIVSGDKDLLQLIGDNIVMWDPMKDREMNTEAVQEKYKVSPDMLLDLFALIGDSSDNIPGVPGVGPKTAEKLINEHQSLEGLYANVDSMKKSKMKEKIIGHRDDAFLARDLIRLKVDAEVPLELSDYALNSPDDKALADIYSELEFSSLLKGLDTAEGVKSDGFHLVNTLDGVRKVVEKLKNAGAFVLDTETSSLDARTARLVGLSFCTDLEDAFYIPVGHRREDGGLAEGQLPEEEVKALLEPLFMDAGVTKIAHNLKYDYTVILQQWGIPLAGQLVDTMIAAHLLEQQGRSLKLDELCLARGIKLTPFSEVVGNDKREDCFAYVELDAACSYSCEDVYGTWFLWEEFRDQLTEQDLDSLFYHVEMPLVPILAAMEVRGICIDTDILAGLSDEFSEKLAALEERIYGYAGKSFNINSPRQLGEILFEDLKLPHGRKTKTGYSTDVKVLEKLAAKHALPACILEYRTLAKLLSTYVEKLALLKDGKTGRIHTSFNQAVTATGRLSSSNPNLQNIPIRGEEGNRIRQAFVPEKGYLFIAADYSQIDLRVLAHYSQDKALLAAFNAGGDIHAETAGLVFGVSPLLVTPEMRRVAKSINFGIVYGMSSFGLSSQLNISRKEAQTFIDRYFNHYPGVKQFMHDIVEKAREDGYVTTLLHRRRSLPEINVKNKMRREFAERTAINTPIQGTAADIIKLAMLRVEKVLADSKVPASLLLQIHDELVFEVAEERVEEAREIICTTMEDAMDLDVPLVVNAEVGRSLAKV